MYQLHANVVARTTGMSHEWWDAADNMGHPVVMQPELGFGPWLSNLTSNTMSWAYLPYAGRWAANKLDLCCVTDAQQMLLW